MIAFKIARPILMTAMRILSVVIYVLTILAAYGGHVNPDYLTLPSMMTLVLPYFAILTFLLIIFWAFCRKIFFTALGVGTIFLCLSPLSQAVPLGMRESPSENAKTFKIISWNVLHTEDVRFPDYPGNRALEYMINSDADIICLAEMRNFSLKEMHNASEALRDSLFNAYPYRDGSNWTDIKILSKYPVECIWPPEMKSYRRIPYNFFKINFPDNRTLTIGMVHLYSYDLTEEERQVVTEINSMETAKTSVKEFKGSILSKMRKAFRNRAEEAKELRNYINTFPENEPLIVCGDFNDVPASWTYNLLRGDDMRDAYSETNIGPAFTYNLHRFYFHIDQMLYRGALKALDLNVGKINSSDHYPLIGEFEFTND